MVAVHRHAITVAQEAELACVERARARGRGRDHLERASNRLERVGFIVGRELLGVAEEQLLRAAARRYEPHANLDESHVQLGVRLHA